LAVIFVYLILAAQFESFIEPFAIMLSLPLSIVGMAGMLLLTGDTVNIMSLIGLIMLMGLVTKNAILLVDYAKVLQTRGMERSEAVITAGRTRLRPILMTTLAMIFGMLPLALGIGAGAEMRAPMARAVVGGLITSTFLTLLVVPVVYTLLDDFAAWVRRRWDGKMAAAGAVVGLLVLLHGIPSVGPSAAAAGDEPAAVEVLTLDEALRAAVANNRDVAKAMELQTLLEGKYVEERAAALPQFLATAEAKRSWDESQVLFSAPPAINRYTAQVGVTQPLYSSGAVAAGIRAAGKGLATADDRLRIARDAALREVHAVFHDILLAREMNRIAIDDLAQKARHLDEARKKYAAGTATDYDVLAAEVTLRNVVPEVVRTENSIRTSRERLRFLLGRDGREVDAKGDLAAVVAGPPNYDDALGTAVARRPELSDLRHRQGVAQELLVIARTGNRPRLDFRGDVGWQEIDFGIGDIAGKTWSAGVFATWPLFDGLRTRGRVAQAGSDVRTLRIEEAQLLDAIALEVRDAVNAVREAGEIVNALAGTVDQADRLVVLAEKGYEYGVKTRLDVDDAQLNRSRALGNLARARRDYLVAGAALRHATGTLGDGIALPAEGKPAFRPA
ncbi:MAG TPA: efflux RND transporter permease subunit, partial [Candidatus Deferrimicrobium sp.]